MVGFTSLQFPVHGMSGAAVRIAGRRRSVVVLMLIALAVLLVQPVCAILTGHVNEGGLRAHSDAGAGHEAPCCSSIEGATLGSAPGSTLLTNARATFDVPDLALAGAALRSGLAIVYRVSGRFLSAGPPPRPFYARSARILR